MQKNQNLNKNEQQEILDLSFYPEMQEGSQTIAQFGNPKMGMVPNEIYPQFFKPFSTFDQMAIDESDKFFDKAIQLKKDKGYKRAFTETYFRISFGSN